MRDGDEVYRTVLCTAQLLMNAQGRSLRDTDRDKIRFGTRRAACEEPYSSRPSVWLNHRPYMLLMRYNQRYFIVLLDSNAPSTVWATLHHCEGATEENEDPWNWSYKSAYHTRLWLTDFNWFDGIQSHILAARTVANIIRTSLGPRGKR